MKPIHYRLIRKGISDTAEATRGKNIFYQCLKCSDVVPSVPKNNINCKCGNIGIDRDMNRLFIDEYDMFAIVEKIKDEK